MCFVTPLNSDDEERVVAMESMLNSLNINTMQLHTNDAAGGSNKTVAQVHGGPSLSDSTAALFSAALSPFQDPNVMEISPGLDDVDSGEYVTITDIGPKAKATDSTHLRLANSKTEYVSLNELPCDSAKVAEVTSSQSNIKLRPNANGVFMYDSNSLRYKRGLCTTFKEAPLPSSARLKSIGHTIGATVASQTKRMNAVGSPPFVNKMALASDCDDQHDVYVTLAGSNETIKKEIEMRSNAKGKHCMKCENDRRIITISRSFLFFPPEIDTRENKAKSSSWPISSSMAKSFLVKTEKQKRRLSWESLTSAKPIQALRKTFPVIKSNRTKSKTSGTPNFKTSTPLKNAADSAMDHSFDSTFDSFGNSTAITLINESDKSNESVRSSTCRDRLGVPKTSLNDFKRLLLLTTAGKNATAKPSAVEQLKLKRDLAAAAAAAAATPQEPQAMKILDLSCSPKSFTNRRILQSSNASPFKKTNLASPRSRWKYNSFSKNAIASIPEANAEEDECGSGAVVINIHMPITPPKLIVPKSDSENVKKMSVIAESESAIIDTHVSMAENIFLQTEENNFMRGEVKPAIFATKISQKPLIARKPNIAQATAATDEAHTKSQKTLETSF